MVKEGKEQVPFLLRLLVGCKLLIGFLAILGAIILGLVGTFLLANLGTDLGSIIGLVAGAGAIGIAIGATIIGLIEIILALGLLHLRKWAWWVNIILYLIYAISGFLNLLSGNSWGILAILYLAIVIYLFRIRTEFGVKENVL